MPPETTASEPASQEDAVRVKGLTARCEGWRAVASGTLETAGGTFLVLVAVGHFQASATEKGLIAGASSFGMLLTPLVVHWVARVQWPTTRAAALLSVVGGAAALAPCVVPSLPVFLVGSIVALASVGAMVPLLTQVYQDNYPDGERGRLFSSTLVIRIIVSALFGQLAGWFLSGDLGRFRWLVLVYALAFFFSTGCLARCPSRPLSPRGAAGPLHALHWVRDDALFRRTLIAWMLMGFANLMMVPLRIEYLANPRYELEYSAEVIALVTIFVPNLVRLGLSPVWGRLFDRVNFFRLRIAINLSFALGILAFFAGESLPSLMLAAVFIGVGHSGGDVAWNLWVTKLAPPGRGAEYMSVHTFFAGLRGLVAPLAAFHLAREFSLVTLGLVAAGLIAVACAILLPEARANRLARRGGQPAPE